MALFVYQPVDGPIARTYAAISRIVEPGDTQEWDEAPDVHWQPAATTKSSRKSGPDKGAATTKGGTADAGDVQ